MESETMLSENCNAQGENHKTSPKRQSRGSGLNDPQWKQLDRSTMERMMTKVVKMEPLWSGIDVQQPIVLVDDSMLMVSDTTQDLPESGGQEEISKKANNSCMIICIPVE